MNQTDTFQEVTFIPKDMNIPISIGIVSCLVNFAGFFLFYNSSKKASLILSLMMLMCLCESVSTFSLLAILVDIQRFINFFKFKEIYSFLTFNLQEVPDINNLFLNRINVCLFNSFLNMNFLLNICYCYEVIQIFKNPISNAQARKTYYLLISFITLFITFIIKYSTFEQFSDNYNERLRLFWDSQHFVSFILIFLMIVALISVSVILSILCAKTSFNKERVIFMIKHIIYIAVYILIWTLPLMEMFTKGIDSKLPFAVGCINSSGLLLFFIRILELNVIANCFYSNQHLNALDIDNKERLDEFKDNTLRQTLESTISPTIKHKPEKKLTFSAMINSSFLIEYMFYIFQGIFQIAGNLDHPYKGHIDDSTFKGKEKHYFKQLNVKSVADLERMSDMDHEQTKPEGKKNLLKRIWNFITCSGNITIIEYAPHIFRNILIHDKVNSMYLLKSFNLSMNISNISKLQISEGKSGSFFFFTYDNKFLIKTISSGERKALLGSFLKNYYHRINQDSNGISTLMGRIYGVYTLKIGFFSSVDVILMENLCPVGNKFVTRKFDLKGSLLGRETTLGFDNNNTKTLKDKDFIDLKRMNPNLIEFNQDDIDDIEETMRNDILILSESSLMDYSFFITIVKRIEDFDRESLILKNRLYYSKDKNYMYFIGIIDYLVKFNNFKRLENTLKSIFNYSERMNISAVHPDFYSQRFFNYMSFEVFGKKNKMNFL